MANASKYGFKWVGSLTGAQRPPILVHPVASGVDFQDDSAVSCDLKAGDPVSLANGFITVCAGGSANVYGVVASIPQVKAGVEEQARPFDRVPNQVAYGTDLTKQTLVGVIPAAGQIFAVRANSAVADKSAALAKVGENADHVLDATTDSKGNSQLTPKLVIGSSGTGTAQWRVVDIDKSQDSVDFDATDLGYRVTVNETAQAPVDTTGT